jgi:hypothetical protein
MEGSRIEEFLASKAPPQNQEERLKLMEQVAHIGLGELRWQYRPGKLSMEAKLESTAEKVFSKISTTNKGDLTVVAIDLDFEEALGTRLKEGTNHKRAATESSLEPFQQLQFCATTVNPEQELSRTSRYNSEDPETAVCAEERRSATKEHQNHPTVEYDANEMSGRSPRKRKRQHSSVRSVIDDNAPIDTKPFSTSAQERLGSADDYVSFIY